MSAELRKIPRGIPLLLGSAFLLLISAAASAKPVSQFVIEKSNDTGGTLIAGGTVTYTITMHCNGPNGCPNTTITDTFNPNLINLAAHATEPDKCTFAGQVMTCDVQGLGSANSSDVITVTADVAPATPGDTVITNCADLESHGYDLCDGVGSPDARCPGASVTHACDGGGFIVTSCPIDLAITKTATDMNGDPLPDVPFANTVAGNADFKYHVVVANNGTGNTTNVTVSDTLPAGVAYVSDTGACTGATAGDLGATLTCNVGTLNSGGGNASFDIVVTAKNSGSMDNTATVASDSTCDFDSTDDSSTATIYVLTANVPIVYETDREDCPGSDSGCVQTVTMNPVFNRVFSPSETARVDPTWKNTLNNDSPGVTGTASLLTGPGDGVTATYAIDDDHADYGAIPAGGSSDCQSATGDCYEFTITQTGATRPSNPDHPRHWDGTFHEELSTGETFDWSLHVGESFPDVPRSNMFYRYVETIFHNHITVGCQGGSIFCPGAPTTRQEMAAFISRSLLLKDASVPTTDATYDCVTPATPVPGQFVDVTASNYFCRHANYLKKVNVTTGCFDTTHFCPLNEVSRADMAIFIARAHVFHATASATPDADVPQWKQSADLSRQYNCTGADQIDPDTLNTIPANTKPFADVSTAAAFCKHAGYLFTTTIQGDPTRFVIDGTNGTSTGNFNPGRLIRRDETAKILANAFGDLPLYGPLVF